MSSLLALCDDELALVIGRFGLGTTRRLGAVCTRLRALTRRRRLAARAHAVPPNLAAFLQLTERIEPDCRDVSF